MSPPGLLEATSSGRTSEAATRETLLRDAIGLMAACGVARSHAWTRQVVRDYSRATIRVSFGDYLAARLELSAQQRAALYVRPEYARAITYVDHTGETAARNVDRERGWPGNGPH